MHEDALRRLRHRAREAGLDGLLLFAPVNLQYLTGFHSNAYSRPLALLLSLEGDPALLVPRLEDLQARRLTHLADVRSYVEWDAGSAAGGAVEAEWRALLLDTLAGRPGGRGRRGCRGGAPATRPRPRRPRPSRRPTRRSSGRRPGA